MYNETLLTISIISALFILMLDYGLGKPGDEKPNYGSLLFIWSFYLAKKRLIKLAEYSNYKLQYDKQMETATTLFQRKQITKQFHEIIFTTARPYFIYEMILGMCPICTHFWITLFFMGLENIFSQKENIIIFGFYFLISHFLIRLFKKLL